MVGILAASLQERMRVGPLFGIVVLFIDHVVHMRKRSSFLLTKNGDLAVLRLMVTATSAEFLHSLA